MQSSDRTPPTPHVPGRMLPADTKSSWYERFRSATTELKCSQVWKQSGSELSEDGCCSDDGEDGLGRIRSTTVSTQIGFLRRFQSLSFRAILLFLYGFWCFPCVFLVVICRGVLQVTVSLERTEMLAARRGCSRCFAEVRVHFKYSNLYMDDNKSCKKIIINPFKIPILKQLI